MSAVAAASRGYLTVSGTTGPVTLQVFDNIEILLMADLEVQLENEDFIVVLESEFQVILEENDYDIEVC